ncbi:predicted protein [Postia placenta Mad-698-R]|nr:predicted protein [Postia placenta Mad-698-R]
MSSRSATPASTPSLVNRRLASLLVVLEAPPTADAALDVVEEWAQDLSPLVKTPRTLERPFAMTEVDMAAAAIVKRQAGQKCDRCAGYRLAPVECVWVENATTCERCAQFQQGCYFDKVSVLGKTKKTRGGGSTTKKRIRPTSPGPSVADSSGSKKRRVDEPPRPLLRLPLDGAGRLGLEQDDLNALDLDDKSRGIIRVIREERSYTTWTSTSKRWRRPRLQREESEYRGDSRIENVAFGLDET